MRLGFLGRYAAIADGVGGEPPYLALVGFRTPAGQPVTTEVRLYPTAWGPKIASLLRQPSAGRYRLPDLVAAYARRLAARTAPPPDTGPSGC